MKIEEDGDFRIIANRLKSDWTARDQQIEEMRDIRFMENDLDFPLDVEPEEVRTPEGHQIIERMTGTLTADPITITVPPADESAKAQENSSNMEVFAQAAVRQLEKQADTDVIDKFVETLIADGHGCMRMLHAPQIWKNQPTKGDKSDDEFDKELDRWKKGNPLPIAWNWVDPLTVYPLWSEFGLEAVLEEDERDILTLHTERWNQWQPSLAELSRMNEGNARSVTFQQLWTDEEVIYAVENEIVHRQEHDYGTPPYTYAMGLGAASNDPEHMGYSVLYPVRYLLPYQDRLLSQKGTAIRIWSWPTVVLKSRGQGEINEDGTAALRKINIAPGKHVSLYEDEDVGFLTWEGAGPDADKMISLVQNMIQRAGISDVMFGLDIGQSGYAINQLIAAARMRYKPIIAHAQRAIESQIERLFDIIEYQIKQPIHVYNYEEKEGWISLGPDDLKGYRNIHVRLNPIMPTDEYATSSRALNEVSGGLRSRPSAMEMIGIEQPDEEMRKIRVDRWMNQPEVDALMTQEAVKRLGLEFKKGDVTMSKIQDQYPDLPPALQQELGAGFQETAPEGSSVQDIGMTQPFETLPAELQQAVQQIAEMYGVSVEQVLQTIQQMAEERGMSIEQVIMVLMQQVQQQQGQQQQGQRPPTEGEGVMAAPGVRAIPENRQYGPRQRPSGVAQGAPSGPRRTG